MIHIDNNSSSYVKNKKVHKLGRMKSHTFGWVVRPLCYVDNTTSAYKGTTDKKLVNCQKCLKKMEKDESKSA
jgi:hypothetical protein